MNQEMDIAREPVDISSEDGEFMDTGVLHEGRLCRKCADNPAKAGHSVCLACLQTGEQEV